MAELVQAGSAAIEVSGLTKSYGAVHAVRGIDLTVERPPCALPVTAGSRG
jgi:ABC-type sugar transport system ATPase subunit